MDELFNQVRIAIEGRAYYLALYASLTIPDICSAMDSANGEATGPRYITWFDRHVAPKYTGGKFVFLDGATCYRLRCSILHQGRARFPQGVGYSRVLFVEPSPNGGIIHRNILNGALNIDVSIFCNDIVAAAQAWLATARDTPNFQKNYPQFMQRYPEGLAPYIGGTAVIA